MPVPLPNLEDRRWSELLEEGRALIPVYERSWTDHNVHDPGIMLVELLAWVAEMDIYWLNRVPEAHLRKFLSLAGFEPAPPTPARAVLHIELRDSAAPLQLPRDLVFEGTDAHGQTTTFRNLRSITAVPGKIIAILSGDGPGWTDLTGRFKNRNSLLPFGSDPRVGSALAIGFSQPLPNDVPVSIYFTFADQRAGHAERQRLLDWLGLRSQRCKTPEHLVECWPEPRQAGVANSGASEVAKPALEHQSVRLVWEFLDASGDWRALDPLAGEVVDDTRSLTLNGPVFIKVPEATGPAPLGEPERVLHWVRCRAASGTYDAPPSIASLSFNGVALEQSVNPGVQTWLIADDADVSGPEPAPGEPVGLSHLELSKSGVITRLTFDPEGLPGFLLLKYRPPETGQPGQISLQCEALDAGDGRPFQSRTLAHRAVDAGSLRLLTREAGNWVDWRVRTDLDASGAADANFVLDACSGEIRFGDGNRGRALPSGALPLASYRATHGAGGNLPTGAIRSVPDNPLNLAIVDDFPALLDSIETIGNPIPASGGAAAESVDDAVARMRAELGRPQRAVTLDDIRHLAFETPGIQLSRVAAIPNLHPAFPCLKAPGVVTVIVLPRLPERKPMSSPGLLAEVRAYLTPRRVIGTRLIVIGPRYTALAVNAKVRALPGIDQDQVQTRIEAALDRFFDPLVGGSSGEGWPFGRDVYRTEVLKVIDDTTGVDHVLELDMVDADGNPGCVNLCVGPLSLVCARDHQIEVI